MLQLSVSKAGEEGAQGFFWRQTQQAMKRTKQNTLDKAGFTYNPFSSTEIWTRPTVPNLTALTSQELPLGNDGSALPAVSGPGMRNPNFATGSETGDANFATAKEKQEEAKHQKNLMYLLAFAAVLAVAAFA